MWAIKKHNLSLGRNLIYSQVFGLKEMRSLVWEGLSSSRWFDFLLEQRVRQGDFRWGDEQTWNEKEYGVKPGYALPKRIKFYVFYVLKKIESHDSGGYKLLKHEIGNEWNWIYGKQNFNLRYSYIRNLGEYDLLPLRVKGELLSGDYYTLYLNSIMQLSKNISLDASLNVYYQPDQDVNHGLGETKHDRFISQVRIELGGAF
jgi:hypothetical protein